MDIIVHFFQKKTNDTIFTLTLCSYISESTDIAQILFNILWKKSSAIAKSGKKKFFSWLQIIIEQMSKNHPAEFTAPKMSRLIQMVKYSVFPQNTEDATLENKMPISQWRRISKAKSNLEIWEEFFKYVDKDIGNNVLMILAKHRMDEALREILTNTITKNNITHSVISMRNKLGETLMGMIEVHWEHMVESMSVLLKLEYACHAHDLTNAQICLSGQIETSLFSFEIIKALKRLEPMTWSEKLHIFMSLFIPHLLLNVGLTMSDWFADGFLVNYYWNEWHNETINGNFNDICINTTTAYQDHWTIDRNTNEPTMACGAAGIIIKAAYDSRPNKSCPNCYDQDDLLKPYAKCLDAEMKFYYTLLPIIGPILLYLVEFFVLSEEYEPTGLRTRIGNTWGKIWDKEGKVAITGNAENKCFGVNCNTSRKGCLYTLSLILRLIMYFILAILAIILWMPVSATCKFIADYKYESSTGDEKVSMRRRKKCMDLAASRGEQMEVSIEDVFEPMIQGYIVFPSIISLSKRLFEGMKYIDNDTKLEINLQLETVEIGQMFSIIVSMLCLAWAYSEYHSTRKNMYLDIFISPFSRIIMLVYMFAQILARLCAFMLFTLYWGPGTFYPLMLFILVHMIISGILHIIFSEDMKLWRHGKYVKFVHNAVFNSLASIYFHNYIHQEESSDENTNTFHTSTLPRQLAFDGLYLIEFVVLLTCGFLSDPFQDFHSGVYCNTLNVILIIAVPTTAALLLRFIYYVGMHVSSDVIWSTKDIKQEEKNWCIRYYIVCRNTWVLGNLKDVKFTIFARPMGIYNIVEKWKDWVRTHISKDKDQLSILVASRSSLCDSVAKITLIGIYLSLFLLFNCIVFGLLQILNVLLLFPMLFISMVTGGYSLIDPNDADDAHLDLPPHIDKEPLSQFYPKLTLSSLKQTLGSKSTLGHIDISNHGLITCEEWEGLVDKLMLLDREMYPLKTLDLTNCYITKAEMVHVAPLIAKFEHVKLNGYQTLSDEGWKNLNRALGKMSEIPNCIKLKKLELKIKKKRSDIINEGKNMIFHNAGGSKEIEGRQRQDTVDFSEFDGLSMSKKSLTIIAEFMPMLEEVYLNDVFAEPKFSVWMEKAGLMPRNSKTGEIDSKASESWNVLATNIVKNKNNGRLKLKRLSLSGCQINDDTLHKLAPALVHITHLNLADNPNITGAGWKNLFDILIKDESNNLKFLSLASSTQLVINDTNEYFIQLANVLSQMEEVDVSGQAHITIDLLNHLGSVNVNYLGLNFKLKKITVTKVENTPELANPPEVIFSNDAKPESNGLV